MPNMTLQQAYDLAVRHHEAGQLDAAESLYRQILSFQPDHPDTLHLLGVAASQRGRNDEAIDLIGRALSLNPEAANYASNLGVILGRVGRHDEAMELHRRAVAMRPDFAEGRVNLAAALYERGDMTEAADEYDRLLADFPDHPAGWNGRGNVLMARHELKAALAAYQRAVALRPGYADAWSNVSNVLRQLGRNQEAIEAAQRATGLDPRSPESFNNLGTALQSALRLDEAIAAFRQAVALKPDFAQALGNLGAVLQESHRLDEAVEVYRAALALKENYAEVYGNLGNAFKEMGRMDEALANYRRATSIKAECRAANNLLFGLYFHPDYGPREIYEEHARWNRLYAQPLAGERLPHENDRSPERRLRVGYVSPDFNVHPVGRFLLPLLAGRDRANFDVVCYSDVRQPDFMTERLRAQADAWHVTIGLSDEQLAQRVRADRIDILVDLAMHADGSRLLAFARKPAPVQVTYLAYAGTTGLETMDYRLTDRFMDPPSAGSGQAPGADETVYAEKSVRLLSYWCYQPPAEAPAVGPLPATSGVGAGAVTFGCLNNYSKVSPKVLAVWCALLRRVPGSRVVVFSREGAHRQRALDVVKAEGVDPARFQFVGPVVTAEYFRRYLEIDIGLDPFPYPGGTTTCDALWMGVPVVTLEGRTAVSRGGVSILSNVGLAELIARTPEEYVEIAAALAGDLPRLAGLRAGLRGRMLASPLMDAPGFVREVEEAFRQMWRAWCRSGLLT